MTQELAGNVIVPYRIAQAIIDEKVVPGWNLTSYCRDAWENNRHVLTVLWGEKGNFKSALTIIEMYKLLQDWDKVLHWTITSRLEFKDGLKEIAEVCFKKDAKGDLIATHRRIACMNLDDVAVYLPTNLYYVDNQLWSVLKSDFTAIRVGLANLFMSAPKKKDILDLFLSDMNFDCEVKSSKYYTLNRWIQETDPYDRKSNNERAIQLNPPDDPRGYPFNPYEIPTDIFSKYELKRLKLAAGANQSVIDRLDNDEEQAFNRMPLKALANLIYERRNDLLDEKGKLSKSLVMAEFSLGITKAYGAINYLKDSGKVT